MTNITKTQIKYLSDKLDRIINDKLDSFKTELSAEETWDVLKDFKLTLVPRDNLVKGRYFVSTSYALEETTNIQDFYAKFENIRRERIENKRKKRKQLEDYRDEIMDSCVLGGMKDLSAMIKKLEEM